PGRVAEAYGRLSARGAVAIVSVHVGAELSGTLNAAHLAARTSPVPVRLVDTGSASFVVAFAAWAAADAGAAGAPMEDAVADALASRLAGAPGAVEIVRYRVGPSVGAHTGPGTAGAVYHPTG